MKYTIAAYALTALLGFNVAKAETRLRGDIEGGVWTLEGSPYIIEETVNISEGDSLTIEPGIWVIFDVDCGITTYNSVVTAVGTPEDSIWFVSMDSTYGWRSIALGGMESSGRFEYCQFYGSWGWWEGQGALADINSAVVRNCTFRWCDSGISMIGGGIIEDCYFDSMNVNGIYNASRKFFTVQRCVVDYVRYRWAICGINARIFNCTVMNSFSNGGSVHGSSVINTIFQNVLSVFGPSSPDTIMNNSFYDYTYLFFPHLEDPPDGFAEVDRINNNGDSTDVYGNIFLDPLLVEGENPYPEFYYLQEESPCIDAGDPEADLDPDSTRADIGAFYFHHEIDAIEPDDLDAVPSNFGIVSIHPNPFNSSTLVSYYVPYRSEVNLQVFNLRGVEIANILDNHNTSPGFHQVIFDGQHITSGIYLLRLKTKETQEVRKITLIR